MLLNNYIFLVPSIVGVNMKLYVYNGTFVTLNISVTKDGRPKF